MRRAHRLRCRYAVAAVTPAALLLMAGCGIQETDVIEAGGPATLQAFVNRGSDVLLFFHGPDGRLSPVIRSPAAFLGPSTGFGPEYAQGQDTIALTGKSVRELFAGPAEHDRAAGLGTGLPRGDPNAIVQVGHEKGGEVEVVLPIALDGLDETALSQLVCTIAYAQDSQGEGTVRLTGRDLSLSPAACGIDINADPAPVPTETGVGRAPVPFDLSDPSGPSGGTG
ncbi:hypothetical protein V1460_28175 [Streptomyces sp. SCSIO 30461]|uniref:hypothetical protein n=1 Tax=Streptomyces sp. SCSIO 30461 TaxID=3118085 RepID=UPI0030CFC292